MEDIIKTVTEFGIALVERQHKFFLDGSIDNSEHVPAIKRIADAAYGYLKRKGVNLDRAKKVKKELINHGRSLFVKAWMMNSSKVKKSLPLDGGGLGWGW